MSSDNSKISSSDASYTIGDLSNYPEELDTQESLYVAVNSVSTHLAGPMSFESDFLTVKSTAGFPESGLLSIDEEVIYYNQKDSKHFLGVTRGHSGKRSPHDFNAVVKAAVSSDHHNALRDAIIKTERKIGLKSDGSTSNSIYGRLKKLETKYLPLKCVFVATKTYVQAGEIISFKDRSLGSPVSWLWDFGDGRVSTERNPVHSYQISEDGSAQQYDVQLTITDSAGVTSSTKKTEYVKVGFPEIIIYSEQRSYPLLDEGTTVTLYDQSSAIATKRRWSFGDGSEYISEEPAELSVKHKYTRSGLFFVSLVLETTAGVLSGPTNGYSIEVTK